MQTKPISVGSRLADSYPFSLGGTQSQAEGLVKAGYEGIVGYLGVITKARLDLVLQAGLGFFGVTTAAHYDGNAAVEHAQALGLSDGCGLALDLEGLAAYHADPVNLASMINAWADAVLNAKYQPILYVGSPQPFTSDELWNLKTVRYWQGQGATRDRFGHLAEPTKCGWCMQQMFPTITRGGTLIDANIVGEDYLDRVPNWVVA